MSAHGQDSRETADHISARDCVSRIDQLIERKRREREDVLVRLTKIDAEIEALLQAKAEISRLGMMTTAMRSQGTSQ